MKNSIVYITMTTMLAVLVACGGKPSAPEHKRQGVSPRQAVADSTIYGKCVDAAMHSLAILADNGDTLHFSLEDFVQERRSEIQGGLLIDDKLAIIAEIHDDLHFPVKIINLTSLQGEWKSRDKDFDIEEGGTVSSHVEFESHPYTTWKIFNGQLVLEPDTFDIITLSDDSLRLESDSGIFEYRRVR